MSSPPPREVSTQPTLRTWVSRGNFVNFVSPGTSTPPLEEAGLPVLDLSAQLTSHHDSDDRGHRTDDRGHRTDECGHHYDEPAKVSAFARITVRVPSNWCPHSLEFVSAFRRAPQEPCGLTPRRPHHPATSRARTPSVQTPGSSRSPSRVPMSAFSRRMQGCARALPMSWRAGPHRPGSPSRSASRLPLDAANYKGHYSAEKAVGRSGNQEFTLSEVSPVAGDGHRDS
jgi:hypothetical protein